MMVDQVKQIEAEDNLEESYDTSDKEQVNKARKKSSRTRADRLEFVRAAMQHEQGRNWFYDLLVTCRVVATPFVDDPLKTAFNCGMQNIGLRVLSDIQDAAPQQYLTMVTEARVNKQ